VLTVIPCLNERRYIEKIVLGLLAEAANLDLKIVVVDGGSNDGTREAVEQIVQHHDRVALIDNPLKIQSVALNEAVRRFGSDAHFLIRIDAHAEYPSDYCFRLISAQQATGAEAVVVAMRSDGKTCFQRAAAAAQNCFLGNGGSSHRSAARGGWVQHGHHALMTMSAFRAVGGYDESFSHVEDVELDARLHKAGFRIYMTSDAEMVYYPRSSVAALYRQYFKVGRGRASNLLRHRDCTRPRHFALLSIVPALSFLVAAPWVKVFVYPALIWSAFCLSYGILVGVRSRNLCAVASGPAAMIAQAGWSSGFYAQIAILTVQRCASYFRSDRLRPARSSSEDQALSNRA
jgi:succinoglycan biosynthesis protein ExoA